MSNNSGGEMDYEKQFQDDLEKAQALSLETLALEKFKAQKLKEWFQPEYKPNTSTSSGNEPEQPSRPDRTYLLSRPRPGSLNNSPSPVPGPIIAPPPITQRRSSSAGLSIQETDSPVPDLISFTSPTANSNAHSNLVQFCEQIHKLNMQTNEVPSVIHPPRLSRSNSSVSSYPVSKQLSASSSITPFVPVQNVPPTIPNYHNNNTFQPFYPNPLSYSANNYAAGSMNPQAIGWNVFNNAEHSNIHVQNQINAYPTSQNTQIDFSATNQIQTNQFSNIYNYNVASSSNNNFKNSFGNNIGSSSTSMNISTTENVQYNSTIACIPKIQPLSSVYNSDSTSRPSSTLPITNSSSLDVFKVIEKQPNANLIDLQAFTSGSNSTEGNVRVSVLEAFDPLLMGSDFSRRELRGDSTAKNIPGDDTISECSGSMYDEFDPFDYLYSHGGSDKSVGDPVYAAVAKSERPTAPLSPQAPPPLPPRNSAAWSTIERRRTSLDRRKKHKSRLYENVVVVKRRAALHDCDLQAFHGMVQQLRSEYVYTDTTTNVGHVVSAMMESQYKEDTSIKLLVYFPCKTVTQSQDDAETPVVTFTCDVSCTIEHVIPHVVCELEGKITGEMSDYMLKVWGLAEYLAPGTSLSDYEYVHQCIKLDQDVKLSLLRKEDVPRHLARTYQDDNRDTQLTLEDILPNEPTSVIAYDTLLILLENLETEMERIEGAANRLSSAGKGVIQSNSVTQSVKAVCTLMGSVEPLEVTEALQAFQLTCSQTQQNIMESSGSKPEIISEDGDYAVVNLRLRNIADSISTQFSRIRDAVQGLIETYCTAFRVDFQLNNKSELPTSTKLMSDVADTVLLNLGCLHRIPLHWKHDDYMVGAQIYHGTRPVGLPVLSASIPPTQSFYSRVVFNTWLNFEGISVCTLPRESRLVLVLYGRTILPPESGDSKDQPPRIQQTELGWGAIQFFNFERQFSQGNFLVSLWPPAADKRLGPAPAPGTHPFGDTHPVIGIEIPDYGGSVIFPDDLPSPTPAPVYDFQSLDQNTQQELLEITEQDTFSRPPAERREVLWEKRHYLQHIPTALPKVLLAAHSWDWACLADLHAMLHSWTDMTPDHALQLLLPCFPDIEVRRMAVKWLEALRADELIDYLPQLVQALKHETFETSALARFLLDRSLQSPRVAHNLYWLLTQNLPGPSPQNSSSEVAFNDETAICGTRYHRRLQLLLRALLAISGEALQARFLAQQLLCKNLYEIAENVKQTKESLRLKTLLTNLDQVHHMLKNTKTSLPLSPSLEVSGIQVRSCSYFPSNTLPLKINFLSADHGLIPAIFKVGDDLQQDMLTLQMMRVMDKMWLREGLDLKMVTFGCVPTGPKRGMIEMVTNAETLRKIQVEWGLTGSFKDKPIAEWLAKHNPSALEYERAVANFTASCAGYSVATYILGICDRHNDNIMLKTSGHLFHIDFGKFLGDAQMFGNFKRDRTPFVLTSDMAYVINRGDKPSDKFHNFVDLCCQAFNIVRKHGNLVLHLFALMSSSGIPGVTMDAVNYVQKALLPGQSNPEAAATFARMIESSLKSWFTQFNFFLHNLAQLRFTGDHGDGELLSFIPKVYTMQQEGRLTRVEVFSFQKRYDPEKYYVYILRIERENQIDPSFLFRSYREFSEFYQKLCVHFPLAKCHSLPSGIQVGRSNIKQVAEKRCADIKAFLHSLFQKADEIAHSDLVYTFFHPLLRDQQESNIHALKCKERRPNRSDTGHVKGQVKLSLQYHRGTLTVMVHHVRALPMVSGGQEPSTYVKVYLKPDPTKATKRKTKVVRRNCHPSFMEMLVYRMSLDVIKGRTLHATVWNHDSLQENEFLGGVELKLADLDLTKEITEWFSLGIVTR